MINTYLPTLPPSREMRFWLGASGNQYWFTIFPIDEIWDFEGIVYIIARCRLDGYFDPLYIGQTGDGGDRLTRHEKLAHARRLGASHVHVYFVGSRLERFEIETDLRHQHWTPLNQQPTPVSGMAAFAPISGLGWLDHLGSSDRPIPMSSIAGLAPFELAPSPFASSMPTSRGTLNSLTPNYLDYLSDLGVGTGLADLLGLDSPLNRLLRSLSRK